MKWLILILFPFSVWAQNPTEPQLSQDIDWFKWTVPYGENAFQVTLTPINKDVDMEIYRMFRAASGNWITSILFPYQFCKMGLGTERFVKNNASPNDTFFIKIYSPEILDTCGDYTLNIKTASVQVRTVRALKRYFKRLQKKNEK